jgi:TetR/AcrR family transcriptional regulator
MPPKKRAPQAAKQTRNAEATRARILEKATEVFAASGFDGASIGDIVKASRVNKRMIYHYFGDKEGLYRTIFRHQWGELKAWFDLELSRRLESGAPWPSEAAGILLEAVDIASDFMASHQFFIRLMMWEGLEGGQISRSIWADVRGPLYAQVEFLIRQAQEDGALDSRIHPAHLVISFLGAVSFYFAYAPTLADMLHQEPFAVAVLAERKAELKRLLSGLILKQKHASMKEE